MPIANGYELRQGLQDRGVPVEMIVYKGFGHGITKPKAMRATMQHNLQWFNHYIFGDAAPDFTTVPPSLPPARRRSDAGRSRRGPCRAARRLRVADANVNANVTAQVGVAVGLVRRALPHAGAYGDCRTSPAATHGDV